MNIIAPLALHARFGRKLLENRVGYCSQYNSNSKRVDVLSRQPPPYPPRPLPPPNQAGVFRSRGVRDGAGGVPIGPKNAGGGERSRGRERSPEIPHVDPEVRGRDGHG